jgi:hypothetical protein
MLTALLIATLTALAGPQMNPEVDAPSAPDALSEEDVEALDALLPESRPLGTIVFDTRLPAEVRIDGMVVAQLYTGAQLSVKAPVGPHELVILTNGTPRTGKVDVPATGKATVMVGRTGLTTGQSASEPDADGTATLQFRVVGSRGVLVQLGDDRFRIDSNSQKGIVMPIGSYDMRVRSADGTVVWANGRLELSRAVPVVVQLAEGRLPEVSGPGSSFSPGG